MGKTQLYVTAIVMLTLGILFAYIADIKERSRPTSVSMPIIDTVCIPVDTLEE